MRMFIASTFSDVVNLFVQKLRPKKWSVLFCANPSDPFRDKQYVNDDRIAFVKAGFKVVDVDVTKITRYELESLLKCHDIFHLCGGSAIYILKLLRDKKMDVVLKNAIQKGDIIYTGTSAGSMIMAPDISFCADDEDEQEAMMVGKVKNLKGFGLMPFYLMCHAQDRYYIPSTKKSMDRLPKNKLPILFLNDNMALWIDNGRFEFLKN